MADLFERINRVERAMNSAEAQGSAIQQALNEDFGKLAVAAAEADAARSPKPDRIKKPKSAAKGARPSGLLPGPKGLSAAVRSVDHMRSIPAHTPLSSVLAQFKEAETAWAHEKARLRREAIEERKRANKLELDYKRLQRVNEHQMLDVKALKTALKSRDSQLENASERIRELDVALQRTQEESALAIASLNAERDDLKGLLLAALQRLEAVDELMRLLEEERSKALDAAARARTEVAELAESRRKLQWQSKLLEKMSEADPARHAPASAPAACPQVQLKHNKRKSEAIRRLLSVDQEGGGPSAAELAAADSELLDDDL
eukprot:XP_001696197.1 predicted protein [Chlamydomonas reinhardtii]